MSDREISIMSRESKGALWWVQNKALKTSVVFIMHTAITLLKTVKIELSETAK